MSEQRNIVISLPLVWGIRNFILSGIATELEKQHTIYYAIPKVGEDYLLKNGVIPERILILESRSSNAHSRILRLLREAHRRKFGTKSDAIFKTLYKPLRNINGVLHYLLAILFSISIFFRWLEKKEERLFTSILDPSLLNNLKSMNLSLGVSTSSVVNTEWPLMRALHTLKVPVIAHILSFDNLTSRGYLPLKYFDKFMVWNERMAKELIEFYEIPSNKIVITGTPQFDFHKNLKYHRSHAWTLENLGLIHPDYILYCANHYSLTPDEPLLVSKIISSWQQNKLLSKYQIVLRLHPMDDYERWNELKAEFPFIKIILPWPHNDNTQLYWGEPTLDDIILFSNTLRYCAMVLNIASTISIDAAILNKPVICIGFSSDNSNQYNKLYFDYHFTHHYEPIMLTKATPLVTSVSDVINAMVEAVTTPDKLKQERSMMIKALCGEIDGASSNRIIEVIHHCANAN